MSENKTLIQSYVYFEDKCFFVSTINRRSSAAAYPCIYSETLIWNFDSIKKELGSLIGESSGGEGSIRTHIKICELIFQTGKCEEEKD